MAAVKIELSGLPSMRRQLGNPDKEALIHAHFQRARRTFLDVVSTFGVVLAFGVPLATQGFVSELGANPFSDRSPFSILGFIAIVAVMGVPLIMKGSLFTKDVILEPLPLKAQVLSKGLSFCGAFGMIGLMCFYAKGQPSLDFSGTKIITAVLFGNVLICLGMMMQGIAEFDFALKYRLKFSS